MLKALLIGAAVTGSVATQTFAAPTFLAAKTGVASTHVHQKLDVKKKAWLKREVAKILEGRNIPVDADW